MNVGAPDFSSDESGDAGPAPHPKRVLSIKSADGAQNRVLTMFAPVDMFSEAYTFLKPSYLGVGSAFHKRGAIHPLEVGD